MIILSYSHRLIPFLVALLALPVTASAGETVAADIVKDGVEVRIGGELFTKYVLGEGNKPFLWPIIGPTGKPMTRAYPMKDVAGEKQDHPHHRSLWFGHQEMDGTDTWHEPLSYASDKMKADKYAERAARLGSTVHREFTEVSADEEKAVIATVNDYFNSKNEKIMEDERRLVFHVDGERRVIDFNLTLIATKPVTLDQAKDAGLSVRVAHSMCVDAGEGGRIVNSEGHVDKDAWSKAASWCDFNGPVEGEKLGVAILNHPSSFRHPTTWHARTYGLFTANPFMADDGGVEMKSGDRVTLRHRIIFHAGDEKEAGIADAYAKYAAEKME